ncbi:hypothetical protein NC651_020047 [Populus alba x Populus x berolinensis]|nr:hypothetical protein NC651_020047 [Populus alba x Populus x berolinensis]
MGWESSNIASHPSVHGMSLKKRMIPGPLIFNSLIEGVMQQEVKSFRLGTGRSRKKDGLDMVTLSRR